MGVQVLIILEGMQASILLRYKEEGRDLGEFERHDSSSSKVFFDKVFASLYFCGVEQVDFSDFGNKVRMEFNGVVIEMVRRKLVMGFLCENVSKVFAPF